MSKYLRKPGSKGLEVVTAGTGTSKEVLIGADEAPHFALRRFVMEANGGMPKHSNTVEHEQYVIRGSAEVHIGDEILNAVAGDVVYIPAGVPHSYKAGPSGFEFLCLIPNKEDKITLLE